MTTWFLTGADTNAGKTATAVALLQAGRARGLKVVGYKPIESGCASGEFGPDTLALANAAQHAPACTYSLADPVAPALAAVRQGIHIDLAAITERATQLQAQAQLMLIEGAGGFLAPIAAQKTIADLAVILGLPVLITASDKLGCINHSLLTIEAAERRGLSVAALILSATEAQHGRQTPLERLDNAAQIQAHTQVPVLSLTWCYSEIDFAEAGERLLGKLLLADAKS